MPSAVPETGGGGTDTADLVRSSLRAGSEAARVLKTGQVAAGGGMAG